tara:strand:- start:93 stop:461 length:369 start_codon:yes stop_codon:yes gene_type:complete
MLKQKKYRSKSYLKWVASKPCLICRYEPCQAHHITIAEHRGWGQKVSDKYTIPLCYQHHDLLHHTSERKFWNQIGIDPMFYANLLFAIKGTDCDNDEWLFDNMYKRIYPLVQNNIDFLMKPK